MTQDLKSIGLGICGDSEAKLSRDRFTDFEPHPVPMQIAIHDPILPQRSRRALIAAMRALQQPKQ